jgi:NAD(P)-dependent dehydrogenase (short-subunit alcohol dehydrogenase family)
MKKTLIIGGSSGVGRAISKHLLEKNHLVFNTYCSTPIDYNHENLKSFHFDINQENQDLDLPDSIDSLIYCPGTINLKPFTSLKETDFLNEFNVNVLGFVRVLKKVIRKLRKSDSASVLGFSSICVKNGFNYHSSTATSKSALEGLFISLAKEYSPKIRFNMIAPSLVDTPLSAHLINTEKKVEQIGSSHPLQRIGKPQDIAALACFLTSEDASWMTGQVIAVDGGKSNLL